MVVWSGRLGAEPAAVQSRRANGIRPGSRGEVHDIACFDAPRGTVIVALPTRFANLRLRGRHGFSAITARAFTILRLGTLWASAGWSSPAPAPPAGAVPQRAPSRLKVLVVTSGGVRNYGDDAILLSTLQRLRAHPAQLPGICRLRRTKLPAAGPARRVGRHL